MRNVFLVLFNTHTCTQAARAAGMFAVGITNQLPAALLAPWAHRVVAHLDEVDPAGLEPGAGDVPGVPAPGV